MNAEVKKTRGRLRVFDKDEALDKALKVFWERGYDGASLAELINELGINKPSLYAAFGNKEELFRQVLTRYLSAQVSFIREAIKEPTAREVAETFLTKAAAFLTNNDHPKGCLIVQGALSCSQNSGLIKDQLIQNRKFYEMLLSERFKKAQSEGDLATEVSAEDLAKYLATLHQGMSVQATNGATQEELINMLKMALKSWPN